MKTIDKIDKKSNVTYKHKHSYDEILWLYEQCMRYETTIHITI